MKHVVYPVLSACLALTGCGQRESNKLSPEHAAKLIQAQENWRGKEFWDRRLLELREGPRPTSVSKGPQHCFQGHGEIPLFISKGLAQITSEPIPQRNGWYHCVVKITPEGLNSPYRAESPEGPDEGNHFRYFFATGEKKFLGVTGITDGRRVKVDFEYEWVPNELGKEAMVSDQKSWMELRYWEYGKDKGEACFEKYDGGWRCLQISLGCLSSKPCLTFPCIGGSEDSLTSNQD
jgi:hypothetical protein